MIREGQDYHILRFDINTFKVLEDGTNGQACVSIFTSDPVKWGVNITVKPNFSERDDGLIFEDRVDTILYEDLYDIDRWDAKISHSRVLDGLTPAYTLSMIRQIAQSMLGLATNLGVTSSFLSTIPRKEAADGEDESSE